MVIGFFSVLSKTVLERISLLHLYCFCIVIGKKILDASYIAKSLATHNAGGFYGTQVDYGYLWFISEIGDYKVVQAAGYGSQSLYVIPELDLGVVLTTDWEEPVYTDVDQLLPHRILPLITDN